MSMPLGNHQIRNSDDDRLIDRLVDGDLPERERRELLLRLETEPSGWRRCAVAFLEAQSWRDALGPIVDPGSLVPRRTTTPAGHGARRATWLPIARLATVAAALVAAFAIGWSLKGDHAKNMPSSASAGADTSGTFAASALPQPASAESGMRDWQPAKVMETSGLPDPVVKHWEKRGYRAEKQERLMSMKLQDGRRLEIPIHVVRLQYVGDRTY